MAAIAGTPAHESDPALKVAAKDERKRLLKIEHHQF